MFKPVWLCLCIHPLVVLRGVLIGSLYSTSRDTTPYPPNPPQPIRIRFNAHRLAFLSPGSRPPSFLASPTLNHIDICIANTIFGQPSKPLGFVEARHPFYILVILCFPSSALPCSVASSDLSYLFLNFTYALCVPDRKSVV